MTRNSNVQSGAFVAQGSELSPMVVGKPPAKADDTTVEPSTHSDVTARPTQVTKTTPGLLSIPSLTFCFEYLPRLFVGDDRALSCGRREGRVVDTCRDEFK